jgi:hypothetical protein
LAGDIEFHHEAFQHFTSFGKPIVAVAGNHDFYGREITNGIKELKVIANQYENVYFLENEIIDISGTRFIGSAFWTNYCGFNPRMVNEALAWMNDTASINASAWWEDEANQAFANKHYPKSLTKAEFHPIIAYQMNQRAIQFISRQLSKPFSGKKVVVTHHAPTHEWLRYEYPTSSINVNMFDEYKYHHPHPFEAYHLAVYGSNLEDMFKPGSELDGADLWCHGHDHSRIEYSVYKTQFASNAFGRNFVSRKLMAEARDKDPMEFITKRGDGSDKLFEL